MDAWAPNGARHGIEYRHPLLDRRVLEFALGLPPDLFIRGPWRRWFMRTAMEGVLPNEVAWNPDKTDPARSVNAIPLMRSAIAEVGRELAVRPTAPSRAAYLEMPRLLADLSPDALGGTRKFGKRLHALQFLDF